MEFFKDSPKLDLIKLLKCRDHVLVNEATEILSFYPKQEVLDAIQSLVDDQYVEHDFKINRIKISKHANYLAKKRSRERMKELREILAKKGTLPNI